MSGERMTVDRFKRIVAESLHDNPSLRYGQACFNIMHAYYPELADRCRGTLADPFYDDKKAERFIALCLLELED